MRKRICTFISLAFLLFCGCAKRGAPPGGPPDIMPPKVIATMPADGDTLVPTDATITIQFDEPIRSDANTVLLYPPLDDISMRFGRRSVEIFHKTRLANSTTYTLILTPQFSDRHNNRIGKPFQMAFSTGQAIDTLQVSGYVLDGTLLMTAQDALVAAYSDSLMSTKPLRITFASSGGEFRMNNMPYKTVWLFAGTGMGTQTDWDRAAKIAVPAKATPLPATN